MLRSKKFCILKNFLFKIFNRNCIAYRNYIALAEYDANTFRLMSFCLLRDTSWTLQAKKNRGFSKFYITSGFCYIGIVWFWCVTLNISC